MKYKGWIYCIRNKINDKKYIGQTSDIKGYKKRWSHHKSTLKHNKHYSKNLQYEFNKFGMDNFEFFILDEFTFSDKDLLKKVLLDMEKFYIDLWDTENDMNGYNDPKAKDKDIKIIQCVETGEIFYTSKEIIDKMFPGRSSSVIRDYLRGRTKSAFGYHFKHIDE